LRFDLLQRMCSSCRSGQAAAGKGVRPGKQPRVPLKALARRVVIFVRRPGAPGM